MQYTQLDMFLNGILFFIKHPFLHTTQLFDHPLSITILVSSKSSQLNPINQTCPSNLAIKFIYRF